MMRSKIKLYTTVLKLPKECNYYVSIVTVIDQTFRVLYDDVLKLRYLFLEVFGSGRQDITTRKTSSPSS
jgi:hypothetical protein